MGIPCSRQRWVGWGGDDGYQKYKERKSKNKYSAFRRSEFSELQNEKFSFPFSKNGGAQNLKNVEKIFLFWNANFFKICEVGSRKG